MSESNAEARLAAAEQHLARLEATRIGQVEGGRDTRFVLRAPLGGVVAESRRHARRQRRGGHPAVPARRRRSRACHGCAAGAALARIDNLTGAELNVPGLAAPLPLDRLVSVGRVLDPAARTVPIIYELRNPDRRIAIGQAVSLRIFVAAATAAVTVPESAVVDDAGQPVVFVQTGGESFERRAVTLGNREGGDVQLAGAIEPGERVVVRGAPFIRLAALSPQVPAHGHTH